MNEEEEENEEENELQCLSSSLFLEEVRKNEEEETREEDETKEEKEWEKDSSVKWRVVTCSKLSDE